MSGFVFSLGRGDDSYWIGMDDATPYPWDRDGGQGAVRICPEPDDSTKWGRWLWHTGLESVVNIKNGDSPAYFQVKRTGYHRLWSKGREPGSRLDQILLTRSGDFNP